MTTNTQETQMTAEKLLEIYQDLKNQEVQIIIDGGWGIDALLGEETRPHKDLDFWVDMNQQEKVQAYFEDNGYSKLSDAVPWHYSYQKDNVLVDIHPLRMTPDGEGASLSPKGLPPFPQSALNGIGHILGSEVRCISAEYRVGCLTKAYGIVTLDGKEINEKDYQDVKLLCDKLNLELPIDFVEFAKQHNL